MDGAEIVLGGESGKFAAGYYYQPTVLTQLPPEIRHHAQRNFWSGIAHRHLCSFGPGHRLANDCDYGLTSSIFTRNLDAAMRASNELKFGETYINREHFEAMQGFHAGWRKSGIGGADGKHGLKEFLQSRVVYMNHDPKYNAAS